jgi:hypothetical protein
VGYQSNIRSPAGKERPSMKQQFEKKAKELDFPIRGIVTPGNDFALVNLDALAEQKAAEEAENEQQAA